MQKHNKNTKPKILRKLRTKQTLRRQLPSCTGNVPNNFTGKLEILKITCFSQLGLINHVTSSEAKMLHPNAIVLGFGTSAYEFGEEMTMQFKAQLKCP